MFCFPALNIPHVKVDDTKFNTEYANVFVHGLAGWGSYTWYNDFLPYWGMFGGDLMQYLNARGFECYSAAVDPTGSAWDRACELYAQLTRHRHRLRRGAFKALPPRQIRRGLFLRSAYR